MSTPSKTELKIAYGILSLFAFGVVVLLLISLINFPLETVTFLGTAIGFCAFLWAAFTVSYHAGGFTYKDKK